MRIDAISIGIDPPREVNVIIEVPVGGEPIKYEMDKDAGTLVVDRFLYTAMRYPGNYGFIPHTLSDDGDPIDVLIANNRPIIPGAVINCRPVGESRTPNLSLSNMPLALQTTGDRSAIELQRVDINSSIVI